MREIEKNMVNYLYTNESMFGPVATEREKNLNPIRLNVKWKSFYPIKIKSKAMTKDKFKSNILTVEAIMKYEMLLYNMSYKQVTRNIYLDMQPTTYHEELMAKVYFSISLLNFFAIISFKPSSAQGAYDTAKIKLKLSFY